MKPLWNELTQNKNPIVAFALGICLIPACKPEDACEDTYCYNGGVVEPGCTCACPEGYSGYNCCVMDNPGGSNGGGGANGSGGNGGGGGNTTVTCDLLNVENNWVSPGGQLYENEREKTLPADYFLTGVGMTVTSDAVVRIMVKGRKLNSNCTLGSQVEYNSGSNTIGLEKQYTVPSGYVITAVGMGIHDNNVNRLLVKYRKLLAVSTGGWRLGDENTYDSGGTIVEGMLTMTNLSSYDPEKYCLAGFGAVSYDSNVWQLWAPVRRFVP